MKKNLTKEEMNQLCMLLDKAILRDPRFDTDERSCFAQCGLIIAGVALDDEMISDDTIETNMPMAYA